MPMYFPDLESVKRTAETMARNKGDKKYLGIIPQEEKDLPHARKALGKYFREVWNDEIQAIEIEEAVTMENYDEKIKSAIMKQFKGAL